MNPWGQGDFALLDERGQAHVHNGLRLVMEEAPMLTDFGLGVSERQVFEEQRAILLASVADVFWARWWITENLEHGARVNPNRSSYGLKHLAEKESPRGYLTNGVFIAAALMEGFRWRKIGDGPNAAFFVKERSVKEAARRVRSMRRGTS